MQVMDVSHMFARFSAVGEGVVNTPVWLCVQDLESTLEPMFAAWRDNRKPSEGFGDYAGRVGMEGLKHAAAAAAATIPATPAAPPPVAAAGATLAAAR